MTSEDPRPQSSEDDVEEQARQAKKQERPAPSTPEGEVTIVMPSEIEASETTGALDDQRLEMNLEEPTVLVDSAEDVLDAVTSDVDVLEGAEPTVLMDPSDEVESFVGEEGSDTEDMLVVLPEKLAGEIPVVETEEIDDEDELQIGAATEAFDTHSLGGDDTVAFDTESLAGEGATEALEDIPLASSNPLEPSEGPTEIVDEEGLEQLAYDLDDEVLADTDVGAEAYSDEVEDEGAWEDSFDASYGEEPRSRRRVAPVIMSFAALAVLAGLGVYFYPMYEPTLKSFLGTSEASASGDGVVTIPVTDPGTDVPAGGDPGDASGVETPVDGSGTEGLEFAAFQQAFSQKVQLALKLGYSGEHTDE